MGFSFFSLSFSIVSLSSRRSSLVPTRIMGVLGQWCLTSGYHCGSRGQSEAVVFSCQTQERECGVGKGLNIGWTSASVQKTISNHPQ